MNDERAERSLHVLGSDATASTYAERHSARMAREGRIWHSSIDGEDLDAAMWAENVAMSDTIEHAHRALMDSPGHRANILNEDAERAGIGVVYHDGFYFITEVFLDPMDQGSTKGDSSRIFVAPAKKTSKQRARRSSGSSDGDRSVRRTAKPGPEPKRKSKRKRKHKELVAPKPVVSLRWAVVEAQRYTAPRSLPTLHGAAAQADMLGGGPMLPLWVALSLWGRALWSLSRFASRPRAGHRRWASRSPPRWVSFSCPRPPMAPSSSGGDRRPGVGCAPDDLFDRRARPADR